MAENTTTANIQERMQKASTTLATMLDYLGLDATVKAEERDGRIALIAVSEDAGRIIGRKGQTLDQLQLLVNRMVLKNDTESPRISIDVDGYSRKPGRNHRGGGRGERSEHGERAERGEHGEHHGGDRGERGGEHRRRDDRREGGRRRFDDRHHADEGSAPRESDAEHEQKIRQQAVDAAKEVRRWGDPVTLPPMNSHDRRLVHVTLKEETDIKTESQESDNSTNHKSVTISLNKQE